MIVAIAAIFAILFTVLLACIMYPIAAVFFVIGKIGYFIGWISKHAFSATNSIIKYLWSDLAGSTKPKDNSAEENADNSNQQQTNQIADEKNQQEVEIND